MNKNTNEKFIDHCGRTIMKTKGIMNLIKKRKPLVNILSEKNEETEKYNNNLSANGNLILYTDELKNQTKEEFDETHTLLWKTPPQYQEINVYNFLINKCANQEEIDRVNYEYELYEKHDLISLLKHLIYLVDHFRKNNVVWGVGRGSSVSSYILYLIGIHKVNSIKYNLDIHEFLK